MGWWYVIFFPCRVIPFIATGVVPLRLLAALSNRNEVPSISNRAVLYRLLPISATTPFVLNSPTLVAMLNESAGMFTATFTFSILLFCSSKTHFKGVELSFTVLLLAISMFTSVSCRFSCFILAFSATRSIPRATVLK